MLNLLFKSFSIKPRSILILLTLIVLSFFIVYERGLIHYSQSNLMMIRWTQQLFNIENSNSVGTISSTLNQDFANMPAPSLATYGRIKLAQHDYAIASQVFEKTISLTAFNPILLSETLIAFSRAEQFDKVILLYKSQADLPLTSPEASEAVALAYLHQLLDEGSIDDTQLKTIEKLAPFALYTTYLKLKNNLDTISFSDLPEDEKSKLSDFPIKAIAPSDERLLEYSIRIVSLLLQESVWDEDRLIRTVRFWIWQYADVPALSNLIEQITAYSAENELLTLVSESNSRNNSGAMKLETTDNESNLLLNPSFETVVRGELVGWQITDHITGRDSLNPKAAFFAGIDDFIRVDGANSYRIDGIWNESSSGFYGAIAVSDSSKGSYYLPIKPDQPYIISGHYRTQGNTEKVSVYIGNPNENFAEIWLAATENQWLSFEHIDCRGGDRIEDMQFLIRLWNEGTVWFDNLAVQPISLNKDITTCH